MDKENQFNKLLAMLNRIKIDDQGLKKLIKQQINNKSKRSSQAESSKEIIRRLRIQNKKLLEQVASLKEKVKQQVADKNQFSIKLGRQEKLNNELAGALGSCTTCWGEDPRCANCSGEGLPGWRKINKRLFNMYILPTLEKLYGSNK